MMERNDEGTTRGFHVSAPARDRYQFEQSLLAPSGKAAIPDLHAARWFAQQMNQKRDLVAFPEQAVRASQINALALIHGITQYVFRMYCERVNPRLLRDAVGWLVERLGAAALEKALDRYVDQFPPQVVYLRQMSRAEYLAGYTGGKLNREIVLEEILMLWLSNANPAFSPFLELFSDDVLEWETAYNKMISNLYLFFGNVGDSGGITGGENIIDFLLAPVRASPYSLEGQLAFMLGHWGPAISTFAYRMLRGMDLIKEEEPKIGFGGPGPIPVPVYEAAVLEAEPERFTPDREWMPNLVLIAKNAYVWLDQLSKKYGRLIARLDEIPDEELDNLGRWGFTGLWLIGLWERSAASQRIKQLCGNPDAVASAYSLFDYQIAQSLGGDEACNNLQTRAWRRGIRLASDMVPNHVGIDGKWVIEHPDWFISLDHSPFPAYSFNGPDLSWDPRVGIYIEDHYYNKSDAAVVFKRVDRHTGDVRYIYHGNDGTSMPWNDTAQLDYLKPEVREAMIQLILRIARQFPIMRFDAAMTLVKRHFHRLWFPEPGSGGAIPSRAEHGMTRARFDQLMPEEFWREVVDRAAVEAPDTLLLAEAFWLMESYFVRTLGMHRVYNSAFMNILRDEDNAKYRLILKNTLEFDPEILRRYVNFMNNPDERTAVDQFGKDDKYFGICTMLVTMPGLPMFGHGQIEGFTEKYGMEYRRAYKDEEPDPYLIARHEREIFPLMKQRYLFAGVENFLLYDFFTPDGNVNENVFAYSNSVGDERSLVVYHNTYSSTRGWVRTSVAFAVKTGSGDEKVLMQRTLCEGLGLDPDKDQFCIFRDRRAGLDYIRSSKELCEQGLFVELGAYQYHVFLDFRVVEDNELQHYRQLAAYLRGRGVPSIDEALREIFVQPILVPFRALVNANLFTHLLEARIVEPEQEMPSELLDSVEQNMISLLQTIHEFTQTIEPADAAEPVDGEVVEDLAAGIAQGVRSKLEAVLGLLIPDHPQLAEVMKGSEAVEEFQSEIAEDAALWGALLGWAFAHALGELAETEDSAQQSRSWLDEWLLGREIANTLRALGLDDYTISQAVSMVKFMTSHQSLLGGNLSERADVLLTTLLRDSDVQQFLGVNRYQDILWFGKEAYEALLRLLLVMVVVTQPDPAVVAARFKVVDKLRKAEAASGYQIEKLRAAAAEAEIEKPSRRRKQRAVTD